MNIGIQIERHPCYTVPDRFFFVGNNYSEFHANISGAAMKFAADFSKRIQLRIKSELPHDWN